MSTRICIPCLSPQSLGGKNTAISLGRCTERLTSVIRRCGRLTRLSVVRPRLSFFISLFSNFMSTPCFSEWEMGYVRRKIDKNMAGTDGNSGFCDYIFPIPPHAIKIYLQVDLLFLILQIFFLSFLPNIFTYM